MTGSAGNVIVAGQTDEGVSGVDILTIKYSAAGVALWTNRYNGPANSDDLLFDAAVDGKGNVFVVGSSSGVGTGNDWVTLAYSSAGAPLWTNLYNEPGNGDDAPFAVALDAGNVFVTGRAASGTSGDCVTLAYSSLGVALRTNRYDGPGNSDDAANAVAVDGSGRVIVTGFSMSATNGYDYATVAYASTGVALWTNRYNGPGNAADQALAVAVDASGRVYVTGYSTGSGGNHEFATIAYSAAGETLWTSRYSTPFGGDCQPRTSHSLVVASSGAVVVVGRGNGSYGGGVGDFATVKYVTVPSLGISLTPTNTAVISWPFPSADFSLEQNTDLKTATWAPPPELVRNDGASKFIVANPPVGKRLFRLRLNQ